MTKMTKEERAVLNAAWAWWRDHRPIRWMAADHFANPAVNATSTSTSERLALAVANWRAK